MKYPKISHFVQLMITAEPGMGKTCSLALLALKWVERDGEFLLTYSRILKYSFVFILIDFFISDRKGRTGSPLKR